MFLQVAELANHPRVIGERYNGVHSLPCIRPRFDGWDTLGEHLIVKILVLFAPCIGLLRGAAISGAGLSGIRQQAEGTSSSRPVAGQTKNNRGLIGAIKG